MIDEDEKILYTYISKDYLKIRTEAPGVRANDFIPNFAITWNYRLGRSSLDGGSWEGMKSIHMRTTYHGTVDGREIPVQGLLLCLRIMYNRPHQVDFYDMQGEGCTCILLARSSTGTHLLDLHSEAGYIFAPFGNYC